LACLRAQAHQRIPTAELARVVNYSPGHFLRLFKKEVGITPADFHLRWRLEAARDELHQPGRSVTEVALRFGFSSSQHFSRAFHQAFGATPRQDRGRAQDRG
jgi:AraC family transcriptional regulator